MKNPRQCNTRRSAVSRLLISGGLIALLTWTVRPVGAVDGVANVPQPGSRQADAKPTLTADDTAIRATADEFAKAFNAGNANALGSLWTEDAEYTDEQGRAALGRQAIEEDYASLFKEHPGAVIAIAIESIRFLAPDAAIEKGVATVKLPAGRETSSRYTVTHVKRDGAWKMTAGRDDTYLPASNEDCLKELDWLTGEWTPQGEEQGPRIKCEWMAQKNFLKNTYTTVKDDKTSLTSVQIIGWNPKLGAIVSWHFDASGGFGSDVWTKEGSKWVIEATGISRDGSESSAINVLTLVDANSFGWHSVRRSLNDTQLPDKAPITMIRTPAAK